MHHILSSRDFVWATLLGAIIASAFTFFVAVKYSQQICAFVFKKIPHEADVRPILGFSNTAVVYGCRMD